MYFFFCKIYSSDNTCIAFTKIIEILLSRKYCQFQLENMFITSNSYNFNVSVLSDKRYIYTSIQYRKQIQTYSFSVINIRKNKTELVIFLFSIFISFFMQEMDKDVIHIYVTIALFCLSFVMISISLVIFFKFRQVHRNLIIMLTLRSA